MPSHRIDLIQTNLDGEDTTHIPPPEVIRSRGTAKRNAVFLALGALVGAGVAGILVPPQSTSPASTRAPASANQAPIGVAPSTGDTVNQLLAQLDAVTETRTAQVAATDDPQRFTTIQYLRQQQDDLRDLIVIYFYGWLPYSLG